MIQRMTDIPSFQFRPAATEDAEALADLRVLSMKDSLMALGRFDPLRARNRFLSGFEPCCTWQIYEKEQRVGFWVLKPQDPAWLLDHRMFCQAIKAVALALWFWPMSSHRLT
jgi:hypothetical protein